MHWQTHKGPEEAVLSNEGCCATDTNWLAYFIGDKYEKVGSFCYGNTDGNGHITTYIKQSEYYYFKGKRKQYNEELFKFVNENEIDIVCCFSRLVYQNLPAKSSFENSGITIGVPDIGGKRDYIQKFIYQPGVRNNCDIALNKPLMVYGFRHPSARCGFCSEHYNWYLQKEIQL